jgi:prepilin-type N-terminal cleavage/methylation domain-containing protein
MSAVRRGFTLIELLVVIAIIGILASIVLVSLTSARIKSRDGVRSSEMAEMQKALELYYGVNGHYPITNCTSPDTNWTSFDSAVYTPRKICSTAGVAGVNTLTAEMASFVGAISDPKNLGNDAGYLYISGDGQNYCFMSFKNPENMTDFASSQVNPVRCPTISNGQCTSGTNSIYIGVGTYAGGC